MVDAADVTVSDQRGPTIVILSQTAMPPGPCFKQYISASRVVSAYLLLVVFILQTSQLLNMIINQTPLGAYSTTDAANDGLAFLLPFAWLYSSIVSGWAVTLLRDAWMRTEYFAYFRTVVLPNVLVLPILYASERLCKAMARKPWSTVTLAESPYARPLKPWKRSLLVGARTQTLLDLSLIHI